MQKVVIRKCQSYKLYAVPAKYIDRKGCFFSEVGLNNKDKDKHTTHREELGKWERNGTVKWKLIASSTGQLRFINILIIYRLIQFFFYIVVNCN